MGSLREGGSKDITLGYNFPPEETACCRYAIAVIDADNIVVERGC